MTKYNPSLEPFSKTLAPNHLIESANCNYQQPQDQIYIKNYQKSSSKTP